MTIEPSRVDRSDPTLLHERITAAFRRAIADGEARPGECLPLANDLAAVMRVNKNSVLRALHLLRDEGILEVQRDRGVTVSSVPEKMALLIQAKELVQGARRNGYGKADLIAMIEGA